MKKLLSLYLLALLLLNPAAFGCAEQTEEGLQVIETLVGQSKYNNYVYKLDSQICDQLEDHSQELYYKLLKEEVMGIYSYTTNDIYRKLNSTLRRGKAADKKKYMPTAEIIISGLKKLPEYKGEVVRFERKKSVNSWGEGKVKTFKAFTSSSKKKGFCWSGNTKLIIKSKTGRFIGMMSRFKNEQEVLFLPKTKFKVLKRTKATKDASPNCNDEATLNVIEMEEV